MKLEIHDRVRLLLVCEPSKMDEMLCFYRDVVGLEEEFSLETADQGHFASLKYDGNRMFFGTPGARDLIPETVTVGVVVMLKHRNVPACRNVIMARYSGPVSEIKDTGELTFFELTDPMGNRVWIFTEPPIK